MKTFVVLAITALAAALPQRGRKFSTLPGKLSLANQTQVAVVVVASVAVSAREIQT